jgi:hypothetical protein
LAALAATCNASCEASGLPPLNGESIGSDLPRPIQQAETTTEKTGRQGIRPDGKSIGRARSSFKANVFFP